MLERLIAQLPERWREVAELVTAPIAWIPRAQEALFGFLLDSTSRWTLAAKCIFLLLPVLLGAAAVWCTQLALYTLPFRSGRERFVGLLLLAWWDAARAVWLYWVGVVRCAAVVAGWMLSLTRLLVRLALEGIRQVAAMPFTVSGRIAQSYFRPGVPWIAFTMLLFWCALEAAIFAYTLFPTVTGVLSDVVGTEETARFTAPALYLFLLLLIMGSFACLQALVDALRTRQLKFVTQIVLVQILVMFLEVTFLYRDLVEAMTPWIALQTGARPAPWVSLVMAACGWLAIRGMTWFLFAQYGTTPLLALIARHPLVQPEASGFAEVRPAAWWRSPVNDFRQEVDWLHAKGDQVAEYLALPVLQLLAAALNFAMVLLVSRPVFPLPFRTLKEVTETRDIATTMELLPRKQAIL
jgi:hypothetical protein